MSAQAVSEVLQDPIVFSLLAATLVLLALHIRTSESASEPLDKIIIGRQSIGSNVYLEKETPVYTNAAAGGLRPLLRPNSKVNTLNDLVSESEGFVSPGVKKPKLRVSTNGATLFKSVVEVTRAGIHSHLEEKILLTGVKPSVLVHVENSLDCIVLTVACALLGYDTHVLANPAPASYFENANHDRFTLALVDGDVDARIRESARTIIPLDSVNLLAYGESALAKGLRFNDNVEEEKGGGTSSNATAGSTSTNTSDKNNSEMKLKFYTDDRFLPVSNVNLTSALNAWVAIFPSSPWSLEIGNVDTLLIDYPPTTLHGFGAALSCIFMGANIIFTDGVSAPEVAANVESVTMALLRDSSAHMIASAIKQQVNTSRMYQVLVAVKLALLGHGVVSTGQIVDHLGLRTIRNELSFHDLRGILVANPIPQEDSAILRATLGVPIMSSLVDKCSLAPVAAQIAWDVATTDAPQENVLPVGPPTLGLELKVDKSDATVSGVGDILIRAPFVIDPRELPKSHVRTQPRKAGWPVEPGSKPENPLSSYWSGPFGLWYDTEKKGIVSKDGILWVQYM